MRRTKIVSILIFITAILNLNALIGCDQIKSFTGTAGPLVGIWDKEGGSSLYREYYQFNAKGVVFYGRLKNDYTRHVMQEGKYKLENNKVMIMWNPEISTKNMSGRIKSKTVQWEYVLDYDPDRNVIISLSDEVFEKSS